jgi:hypothetical protein
MERKILWQPFCIPERLSIENHLTPMKPLTIAFAALAALSYTGIHAQTGTTTAETAISQEKQAAWMTEVGLSEEQIASMKAADLRYSEAMNALSKAEGDRDARVQQSKELRDQHGREIKEILTPEQYTQMKAIRAEKRAAGAEQRQQTAPHNE